MEIFRKKNEATIICFPMVNVTNPETFDTGETVTDTAYYSDAEGAFASLAITDTVSEVGTTGMYEISLTAGEMNHDLIFIKFTSAAAADTTVLIRTRAVDIDDLVRSTTPANALDVSATGEAGIDWANIGSPTTAQNLSGTNIDVDQVVASVSGAVNSVTTAITLPTIPANWITAAGINAAALTTAKFNADFLDSTLIADNAFSNEHFAAGALTSAEITSAAGCAVTSLGAGIIDDTSVGTLTNSNFAFVDANERVDVGSVLGTAQTAGDLAALIALIDTVVDNLNLGIIYGVAQTGTLSVTQATTNLAGYLDDELIGRTIVFTGGTADGQASIITDYASTNGLVTFQTITTIPANNDPIKIV